MSYVSYSFAENTGITVPFPVTHSILSTAALLSEILPLYDIGSIVDCMFLTRGVPDTYLVQTKTKKYILRAYRTGWRALSDVLYELDVLVYLDQKGIPVSTPVAQKDGQHVCTIQAPEGLRQIVLFTYAPGKALDRHDATDSYYHGIALATLHNATNDFTTSHKRAPLDLNYLAHQSLLAIQPLHKCSANDWNYLQNMVERLSLRIQKLSIQGLDWGLCHGDCHMLNDHIDTDHKITFFDFDFCAMGWRAYELAIIRWSEGFYNMDPGDLLWQAFLKGYTEQRSISEVDYASIPAFVALREIWHTALVAWLQPASGIQGFDRILQRALRLLKEWELVQLKW